MLTKRGELSDNLVDDFLELTVLDGALSEIGGEGKEELGVGFREVHRATSLSPSDPGP